MRKLNKRNIHQIRNKKKLTTIGAVLSILLMMLVENSKSTEKYSLQCENKCVEKDFYRDAYKKLSLHSIITKSGDIDKQICGENGKYFTLIKDMSTLKYKSQLSDVFVVEQDILAQIPSSFFLTCSYREDKKYPLIKTRLVLCEDPPKKSDKRLLIVPYTKIDRQYLSGRVKFIQKNYVRGSKLAKNIEAGIAFLQSAFIRIICKKYIEYENTKEKSRMNRFIAFLKEQTVEKRSCLKNIGLNGTFLYDLVGRIEDFDFHKYIEQFSPDNIKKEEKAVIIEEFLENKTLQDMMYSNVYSQLYENSNMILPSLLENEKEEYSSFDLKRLVEYIQEETMMHIDILSNGKFSCRNSSNLEDLKERLGLFTGFKEESKIIVSILSSLNVDYDRSIQAEDIDRGIDREAESALERENKVVDKVFIRNHINMYLGIGTEILQEEVFEWDKELLILLTKKMKYDPSNKLLDEVKADYEKMNKEIISEIEGRRKQIYSSYKRILPLYNIYKERIRINTDILFAEYRLICHSAHPIDISRSNAIEKEIINMLSCIEVDCTGLVEEGTNEKLTLKEKLEQRADAIIKDKEEQNTIDQKNRSAKIAKKEESIREILKGIEAEFLNYNKLEEAERLAKIKENKKKIFRVDFIDIINTCDDKYIVDIIQYIRKLLNTFVNILVSKRMTYINPAAFNEAKRMQTKANNTIEAKNIYEIERIFEFLKRFENFSWYVKDLSFISYDRTPNQRLYTCYTSTADRIRVSLSNEFRGIFPWVDRASLKDIQVFLRPLFLMNINCSLVSYWNRICENPVFLSIRPIYNEDSKKFEKKGYITYRSHSISEFNEKEIEISEENLMLFRNAKKARDIKSIPGKVKKVFINFK